MHSNPVSFPSSVSSNIFAAKGNEIGTIDSKIDKDTYSIKTASGLLLVKTSSGQLSPGDIVTLSYSNDSVTIQKADTLLKNVEIKRIDIFTRNASSDSDVLDLLQKLNNSLKSDDSSIDNQLAKAIQTILKQPMTISQDAIPQFQSAIADLEKLLHQSTILPPDQKQLINNFIDTIRNTFSTLPKTDNLFFTTNNSPNLKNGIFSFSTIEDALTFLNSKNSSLEEMFSTAIEKNGKIFLRITQDGNDAIASLLNPKAASQELISLIKNGKSALFQSIPAEAIENMLNNKNSVPFDTLRQLDSQFSAASIRFPAMRAGSQDTMTAITTQWLTTILDSKEVNNPLINLVPIVSASKIATDAESINAIIQKMKLDETTPIDQAGITEDTLNKCDRSNLLATIIDKLGFNLESAIQKSESYNPLSQKAQLLQLRNQILTNPEFENLLSENMQEHSTPSSTTDNNLPVFFNNETSNNIKNQLSLIFTGLTDLKNELQSFNDKIIQNQTDSLKLPLSESMNRLTSLLKESQQQLQAILKNIDNGSNMLDVLNQLKELEKNNTKLADLFSSLKQNISPDLSVELRKSIDTITDANSKITQHIQSAEQHLTNAAMQGQSSESAGRSMSMQSTLYQSIDSSINRLESLQLLARQQPTADGQQQILALPLKIGNEWTEVNIRLLKKNRSSPKQKLNSSFCVYLNLSPKLLGDISIKLDYTQKKSLKVSMNFENQSTKKYFQQFSSEIQSALKDLGLPLQLIEMRANKIKHLQEKNEYFETAIDLKV